ncbi:MAG: PVC-type heme-binding CxxCH protein [Chthoniobacteraceae bacterium]
MKLSFILACSFAAFAAASDFPPPYNSEKEKLQFSTPAEALAALKLPDGFHATLFANEPDVQNPIAMAWDHRGRMWVAENFTYAERPTRFDMTLRDRVIILEDKDGDGRAESRKVFTDDVQMLTSVEVGRGGVWLMCPPQLIFIPDRNGDDAPDGPPEVMLDGFTVAQDNYHNYANGLRWGPDGWLYGRCGHSCPGRLGVPGTPDEHRVPIQGGVWRFHPQRKTVEVLTHGTTNPWGHDWDRHGEGFFINTVTGHLWHLIPGAHLVDSNPSLNPSVYERMDTIADHWHFDKKGGRKALSDETANSLGGGHAHIGMMIYQADQWPASFRDKLFTLNMHGRRANVDRLERLGSGYVGRHEPDVFQSADPWFRGLEISTGPDGSGYILDWSDIGECHEATGVHRTSGRIFKITHGEPKRMEPLDLAKMSDSELVKLHMHDNEWWVRQARLELAGRAASGGKLGQAKAQLVKMFETDTDTVHQLRALWTLHSISPVGDGFLFRHIYHSNEHVRAWVVRLFSDRWPLDTGMSERPQNARQVASLSPDGKERLSEGEISERGMLGNLAIRAKYDSSAIVRLALASTLQRLPVQERPALASALVAHAEDADDHNLPLMIWYGLIPVANSDPAGLAKLAASCELPLTRRFIARRLVEEIEKNPAPVNALLTAAQMKPAAFQSDILTGLAEGMTGWRKATKPAAWDALAAKLANSTDENIRARVRELSVLFGDGRALDEVKRIALDGKAELGARKAALKTLIESNPPDLRAACETLLEVRGLNATAARGLALFDDPAIGAKLADSYRKFSPVDRPAVMETLVSRPAFAKPLLEQIAAGKIPRTDLNAFHARQIRSFNDPALTQRLTEAWGEVRDSSADKQKLIADLKGRLTAETLARADRSQGRVIFQTLCGTCHTMYGTGGRLGPDLTGSGRANLDYLLENIADPSGVVSADYRMNIVTLKDGRVLGGIIAAQTARTLTLRLLTEEATIEKSEIVKLEASPVSMMPEGQLLALQPEQVRDLIAYLMHPVQVPLPAASK